MEIVKEDNSEELGGKIVIKIIIKSVSVIINIILVFCLLFALYTIFINGSKDGRIAGPYGIAVILSGSMEPEIKTGSLIITKRVAANELKIGDIITYEPSSYQGVLLTHRIIEISDDNISFITQGDTNEVPDPDPAYYDSIRGKLIYAIPLLGKLILFLQVPRNLILFIAIIVICEILWNIVSKTLVKKEEGKMYSK